jgi:cell wall-associated NlpC family hydrolase
VPFVGRFRGTTRPRRALVATALSGALLVASPLSSALAAPNPTPSATPPSAQDVQRAHAAVQSATADVAATEVRLAQLSVVADDAQVAVEKAGEAYSQALQDAQDAEQAAVDASARSQQADADAETARQTLMAFAREMARSGGSLDAIEAVLSSNGFEDVAQRTADLSMLTGKAADTVQQYRAAQLVATTLHQRADDAAKVASAKQADAQTALQTAQKTQADADAQVTAATTERTQLIAQLAAAQQTSVEVEKARQDAIDQANRQRQEDAAKAARLASTTTTTSDVTPASPGGSKGSGGTTSNGGSSAGSGGSSGGSSGTSGGTTTGGAGAGTPTGTATPDTSGSGSSGGTSDGSSGTTAGSGGSGSSDSGSGGTSGSSGGTTGGSSGGAYGLGTGLSRGTAAQGLAAVQYAESQVGKPYVWGGAGPDSYDCSGLTSWAWRQAGVSINRTSSDQYKQILKISYDDLRPGDLVFWSDDPSNAGAVYHVAMWVGGGQIVEASRPGVPLRVTAMRWAGTMPYAGRP